MSEHLDTRQRNNLTVGNTLAAEIAATGSASRAFVIVWPYHERPRPQGEVQSLAALVGRGTFSKMLNADRKHAGDVRYGCAVVEVEQAALARYLDTAFISDSARLEQRTFASKRDLTSLEELEAELRQHINDLTSLEVDWRVLPWER